MPGLKLVAELGGDGRGFDQMMSRAGASVGKLRNLIAGAFTIGAVTNLARRTAEYADRIDETSSRLGVAAGRLQEWEYAAKQSGASAEQLLNFIEKLTVAAADPLKTKFFEQMGFNPNGMKPEQVFGNTAAFARKSSSTDVTRILSDIIGVRVGGTLVNTLQSDLEGLAAQARKVGAVMDQQTLQALAKLNDQFSILSQILYSNFGPALLEAGKILLSTFHGLRGASGWLGARTSNVQGKDVLNAMNVNNPVAFIKGIGGITRGLLKEGTAESADAELNSERDKLFAALDALAKVTPFVPGRVDIQEPEAKAAAARKAAALPTDSLVAVGNFLGRNPGLVNDIAGQQLQVQRQQLQIQQQMLSALRAKSSPSALSMEVPP